MNTKKYQKIIAVAFGIILIYPSVTFASWWNPFSWFRKNTPKTQQVIDQPKLDNQKIEISKPVEEKKKITLFKFRNTKLPEQDVKKPEIVVSNSPSPVLQTAPNPVVLPVSKLSIFDVSVVPSINTVKVQWWTNKTSESKILFNGNAYLSKNGVGVFHSVEISSLDAEHNYSGSITALANNEWANQDISFATMKAPFSVVVGGSTCNTNSCKVSWQANYPISSTIIITKVNENNVSWSFDSENGTGLIHTKNFQNLQPNTRYAFKIISSYEAQTKEIEGVFTTQSSLSGNNSSPCYPTPAHGGCAATAQP